MGSGADQPVSSLGQAELSKEEVAGEILIEEWRKECNQARLHSAGGYQLRAAESAYLAGAQPAGIPLPRTEAYFYVVSPMPWILLSLLVVSHRLLREGGGREQSL